MSFTPNFSIDGDGAAATLRLSGRLTLARIDGIYDRLQAALAEYGAEHGVIGSIDISAVERIDTVGAWMVSRLATTHDAAIIGASAGAQVLIEAVGRSDQHVAIRPESVFPLVRIVGEVGTSVISTFSELKGLLTFFGEALIATLALMRNPQRIRWNAVVTRFETVGVNALAIVGLMTFLIGVVIAQQGAVQLRQFGLEVFTINLVGRTSIRELGLLMTAIMVAGRSGSAFAAQIGTMKLTEEVDAMRTIGVSPMEALVLPRVFATLLMMPLLGFYASITSVIGGGLYCWIGLDIPPLTYIQLLRDIIPMTDMWALLIKAPVFGVIVAITGCYHGMQVKSNAEEVGRRTTDAVVQGIFLVIVLDAFFAVFFTAIGWQ
ncbi:MAG: MlaE family lipid ABC transporter permease subunit [Pseudomonadota bacterium]